MRIPSKFQVGGQEICVEYPERLDDKLGECCASAGYIKIADTFRGEIQTMSSKENTFIHELTHCILDTMGETELSANEKFVSGFAGFLLGVIKTMKFPKSEMWHDKSEKPERDRDILIKTVVGGYAVGTITYPWNSVDSWCYIDNLK